MKIRTYTFVEFLLWVGILCLIVLGIRFYHYEKVRALPSYQIFLSDINGLIVGSPVKYMGVKIGYVKDIKLLQESIYVRFVVTDEDIKLPYGVIATVEAYGLGGSKSLEIYPPDKNEKPQMIIVVQNPTRLSDATGLLSQMFSKINSIVIRCTYFAKELGLKEVETDDIKKGSNDLSRGLYATDIVLDDILESRENLIKRIERIKGHEQNTNN